MCADEKVRELTFIKPFESSPVHCLKRRPCGKRRSPGNDGTALMLKNPHVSVSEKGPEEI